MEGLGKCMKAVILAGGKGTRIAEESQYRPKPMVEIGNEPILWHIMKRYGMYGVTDFIICCGYKGYVIKEYFLHYSTRCSSIHIDLEKEKIRSESSEAGNWNVTLANTGLETLTAGRVQRIRKYLDEKEPFFLTYGDGVGDIDMDALLACHRKAHKTITITITKPAGRFGAVQIDEATGMVQGFKEKARKDQAYVNAGFMVCELGVFDYLGDGSEMLEADPFEALARDGEMNAYIHDGFWSPMDNIHDMRYLDSLARKDDVPWLVCGRDR